MRPPGPMPGARWQAQQPLGGPRPAYTTPLPRAVRPSCTICFIIEAVTDLHLAKNILKLWFNKIKTFSMKVKDC
jgi:hypothetical protein